MNEATTATNVVGNKYPLRDLEARDIFPMSKIINEIGIAEFKTVFRSDKLAEITGANNGGVDANLQEIGIEVFLDIASIIIKNMSKCEQDLYVFIGSLTGLKPKLVESMSMNDFIEIIIMIVQKHEFKDFMKVVSKLFK